MPENVDYENKVITAKVEGISMRASVKNQGKMLKPSLVFENMCGDLKGLSDEERLIQNLIYGMLTSVEMLSREQMISTKQALEFMRKGTAVRPDSTWTNVLEAIIQLVEYVYGPIKTQEETGKARV